MKQQTGLMNPDDIIENTATSEDGTQIKDQVQRPFPRRLILAGLLLVILFLSSFTAWSVLAPIESAVVSPGIISVASHRKQIQHLEGGIVEAILVQDGDSVVKGQLLVKLRDVQPSAELRQLERQYIEVQAVLARLLAEQDDSEEITFPEDLLVRAKDRSVDSVMTGQKNIFQSRQMLIEDKHSVLKHKIAQVEEQINGLSGQVKAKNRQRKYIFQELSTVDEAVAKKLLPKAQALKLRQRLAGTEGELSAYQAEMARLKLSILEMRLQMSEVRAQQITEITEQLRSQRARLFDLSQKIITTRDVLHRTKITSSIDGIVVNLQIHTLDGVIAAGQPLLEVVPINDDLIVNAFIAPEDIEEVRAGMMADVRLTSFSRRQRVPLEGVVSYISADRLSDPETGNEYYQARIRLAPDISASAKTYLIAGMGAEVFIRTGSRTPLDYLLSPITQSLQRGFKEH